MSSDLRPEISLRDQPESPFGALLAALVARVPGAYAAALVDSWGETVDYAGQGDPYLVRIAAAHWRLVLRSAQEQASMAQTMSLSIRAAHAGFAVHALPDGYAIVLLLSPRAGSLRGGRAIAAYAGLLANEAGWTSARAPSWYPVDVVSDAMGRPAAVRLEAVPEGVEVLGRCADRLGWRERAWRVRLSNGIETMLVREPGGFWYADEPLERLAQRLREKALSHNVQERR